MGGGLLDIYNVTILRSTLYIKINQNTCSGIKMIQFMTSKHVCVCVCVCVCARARAYSVVSDSLWPQGLYSLPGSSVHGVFQARILQWAAISSSGGSSLSKDWNCISCISFTAGRFFTAEPWGKPSKHKHYYKHCGFIVFCKPVVNFYSGSPQGMGETLMRTAKYDASTLLPFRSSSSSNALPYCAKLLHPIQSPLQWLLSDIRESHLNDIAFEFF